MRKIRSTLVVGLLLSLSVAAHADDKQDVTTRAKLQSGPSLMGADAQRSAEAIAYYERSRALLLSAVREFDKGYAKANPSVVLDALSWREDVLNRIKELDKVLAPQARITEGGLKLDGQRELLAGEAGKKH